MEWQVTIDEEIQTVNLPEGATASKLVESLKLHPDSLLVVTDEEKMIPIPLVSKLPKKPIRIILVASGG